MRIGIDLGGTKIEGIALSPRGEELARRRISTPSSYETMLEAVTNLVLTLERTVGEHGTVGLGIPGTIVPETGRVKNANSVWLNGQPLGHDLERRLDRPVRVANDANCFALSEATDGAAAGGHVVFGVILGTGVGGGIVVGGECLPGANLVAGEWGHNTLPWMTPDEYPGPECYCGKRGCIESFLSGPAFEQDHVRHAGQVMHAPAIVAAAAADDAAARATMQRYSDRLGRALASLVNLLDPDVIVLGGGMSNIAGLADRASAVLPRYVLSAGAESDPLVTRVVRANHGDSSGVRGAAWLWPSPSSPSSPSSPPS